MCSSECQHEIPSVAEKDGGIDDFLEEALRCLDRRLDETLKRAIRAVTEPSVVKKPTDLEKPSSWYDNLHWQKYP